MNEMTTQGSTVSCGLGGPERPDARREAVARRWIASGATGCRSGHPGASGATSPEASVADERETLAIRDAPLTPFDEEPPHVRGFEVGKDEAGCHDRDREAG